MDYFSRIDRDRATSIVSISAAAALVCYTVYYISEKNKTPKNYKKIPVPGSSYPYIGHLLSIGKNINSTFRNWHNELGPIIKLKMGVQTWVSINDPYIAQTVFSTHGKYSSRRPLTNFGSHYSYDERGIVFGNGERWRICRAAGLSVLAPKMVDQYMEKIEYESIDLVERLLKATEKDGSVNPVADLQLNSLNVILHVTVGKRYDSRDDPEFQTVCKMAENMIKLCAFQLDLPRFLPVFRFMDYISNVEKQFKDYISIERDPIINKLIEEAAVSSDINIMKALDSEDADITPNEKRVIFADIIIGGEDTTRTTLTWAIAILCHHPDVQKKMQIEIDEFIKNHGERPKLSQRNQIPYTASVMKECMRYRAVTFFGLVHETIKDIALDDYIIPKGTTVVAPMRLLHENSQFYDNPEKFIPERFLNDPKSMYTASNGAVAERDHFNFGWGRRICPGTYLAEAEIFNAYVSLFSKCTIEPIMDEHNNLIYPNIDDEQSAGLVSAPSPYKVKIVKRS